MANNLVVEGRITHIEDTMSGESSTGRHWERRTFVIETLTGGNFPQYAAFDLWAERTSMIDSFKINDMVSVTFDINSREYQGKWYTNLRPWQIQRIEGASPQPGVPRAYDYGTQQNATPNSAQSNGASPAPAASQAASGVPAPNDPETGLDDLPF